MNGLRTVNRAFAGALLSLALLAGPALVQPVSGQATGPLRVHPKNPRYFTDGSGRAVYLVGSHTWSSLVDMGPTDPPAAFDYAAYLGWMKRYNHNFMRLWAWELLNWDTRGNPARHRAKHVLQHAAPQPWARVGPGEALDGKPKFNLNRFDDRYFARLRSRVEEAGKRDIYVAVMLFEGWGIRESPGAFENHPFHPANNVNGINGDIDGDGKALEIHTLGNPKVNAVQEAYVRKVIDTVNDLDNVLYEIANEAYPESTEWQYHMIRFIKEHQQTKPRQHPVGMTPLRRKGNQESLFNSPADWISPDNMGGYRVDPPAADGGKVLISDTDHL